MTATTQRTGVQRFTDRMKQVHRAGDFDSRRSSTGGRLELSEKIAGGTIYAGPVSGSPKHDVLIFSERRGQHDRLARVSVLNSETGAATDIPLSDEDALMVGRLAEWGELKFSGELTVTDWVISIAPAKVSPGAKQIKVTLPAVGSEATVTTVPIM